LAFEGRPMPTRLQIIYRVVMTNYSTKCVVWPFATRYKGPLCENQNRHIGKIICEMRTSVKQYGDSGGDKLCGGYCRTPGCIRHVRWFPRDEGIPRDEVVCKLRAQGLSIYEFCAKVK
jgi:hypothetical protein